MPRLYRDEGIVLRTAKLGEADRIITLLTQHHGKIRAVAKGVRRTKSRFGARLEPFMRVDMLLSQGRTFEGIRQVESLNVYADPISRDYESFTVASIIAETANDLVSTEHEPAYAQYRLLVGALHALANRRHRANAIGESYVMRALALAGWTPRLDACVVCGTQENLRYFSSRAGGVMCTLDHTPDSRPVSAVSLRQLRALLDGDWNELDRNELEPATMQVVEHWAQTILERPIRSMRLLD